MKKKKEIKIAISFLFITMLMQNSVIPIFAKGNTGSVFTKDNYRWNKIENKWTYVNSNDINIKTKGWKLIDNKWYYFNQDGEMQIGWLKDNTGKWYFLSNKNDAEIGKMLNSGWYTINNNYYYFNNSGELLINTQTPDGYLVNENGEWTINNKIQKSEQTTFLTINLNNNTNQVINKVRLSSDGSSSRGSGGSGYIFNNNEERSYRRKKRDLSNYNLDENVSNNSNMEENNNITNDNNLTIPQEKKENNIATQSDAIENNKENNTIKIKIIARDIETKEELYTKEVEKEIGSEFKIKEECDLLNGYEIKSNFNNIITRTTSEYVCYYKKMKEVNKNRKIVPYKIEFRSRDNKKMIISPIAGDGELGEDIEIEFQKYINLPDGTKWKAIDTSPRKFKLNSETNNYFRVSYLDITNLNKDELTKVNKEKTYSIKYIAKDTGRVIGIKTGIAKENDKVYLRNNFKSYKLEDGTEDYIEIKEDDLENIKEIYYERVSDNEVKKDELTGKYKGFNFDIFFTDEDGNTLLPMNNGFALDGEKLIIDYPNEIDIGDGYIYKVKNKSPFIKLMKGTIYKTFNITYRRSEKSESKLNKYIKIAKERSNIFKNNIFSEYNIKYKELNSSNDIAFFKGISNLGTEINVPGIDIDGYEVLDTGKLSLEKESNEKEVYYKRYDDNNTSRNKLRQEINFKFVDENDNELLSEINGHIALEGKSIKKEVLIHYPNTFFDKYGNRYEAIKKSPRKFTIDYLDLGTFNNKIIYKKITKAKEDEFVIKNEKEGLELLKSFFSRTGDKEEKELYIIGENYNPKNMIVNALLSFFSIKNYQLYEIDEFELNNKTYYISKIRYNKDFTNINKTEENDYYELIEETDNGPLSSGRKKYRNTKTGEEFEIKVLASGYIDKNLDGIDDKYGIMFKKIGIGDEIKIEVDSKDRGLGKYEIIFTCIDDNYNGKRLFIANNRLPKELVSEYSNNGDVNFKNSDLRVFLNDVFLDGTNLRNLIKNNSNSNGLDERISLLSYEEAKKYTSRDYLPGKFEFPNEDDIFLTKTNEDGKIKLSNGNLIDLEEVKEYGIRPVFALDQISKNNKVEKEKITWINGDLQIRNIGGVNYLFKCIDENYNNTNRALFIQESIIPANIIDDKNTEISETISFGENNNYKKSNINKWIEENGDMFGLLDNEIGVNTSYLIKDGESTPYRYSKIKNTDFIRNNFETKQSHLSKIFIPSLEDALKYKDELFKFNNSNTDNPRNVNKPYSRGYYLRTPKTDSKDKILYVNLEKGNIQEINTKKNENNRIEYIDPESGERKEIDIFEIGIRTMFLLDNYN